MSKGTPIRHIRVPDALWSAAITKARTQDQKLSDLIREWLQDYVNEQQGDKAMDETSVLPGTEWGTNHWGEVLSEPTEGHARGVARITGAKVYSRSPMGEWVEA